MSARLLDGLALAGRLREDIKPQVVDFLAQHGRPPGLAIVLVGQNPASEVYVRNKLKAGRDVGFRADLERLPETASIGEVLALVGRLNGSDVHDGILVQSPLPKALGVAASSRVFDVIAPEKDVDGFTPVNVGRMVQGRPALVACTPSGIIELLVREGIPLAGRRACIIGRSDIVGKPMALLLLQRDATVTICHSKTVNLAGVCREADILVAAAGIAGLVTKEFVKPGATVIDVGMNTVTDVAVASRLFPEGHLRLARFHERGSVLVGDVHPEVNEVAGAITPVPGGVGPLTVTMLMMNTLRAARARAGVVGDLEASAR
jgi:methylenetetrahydrofolate dehydrogenase (NADP+) / methenyltetrahydrofolate cyclohydrolase